MKLAEILTTISSELYAKSERGDSTKQLFNSKTPTSIDAGLSTYKNNLYYGVADALRSTFVVVEEILTSQNFNYFSRKYLLEKHSLHHDLAEMSYGFPAFLQEQKEIEGSPWLFDLAKFELAWENLEFGFGTLNHPKINSTLSIIQLDHQILDIWNQRLEFFVKRDQPIQETHSLVLWGHDNSNFCEPIHPQSAKVLLCIANTPGLLTFKGLFQDDLQFTEQEFEEMINFMESKKWIF